ncbi:molybdate ABC transporter permease subunit [Candidatus Gracilibacteria bacterium]|nr:molybdate ABC transporter permease subunit [Candidatus Gracilibacteria bacterium]
MESSLSQHGSKLVRRRTGPGRRRWLWLAAAPLLLFLVLPLLALLLRLEWAGFAANARSLVVVQALALSITTSLLATALAVAFGLPLAFVLARVQFRGRIVVDTLIDLPMVLPPSVAGIALLMAFGRRGLVGAPLADLGITISFTQLAVVLAQCFVAAPYFVKAAAAGFAAVDRELEHAAALDGAGRPQVFRLITVPLAWQALFSGAVMTWARALGEFGATIIFAGNLPGRTQTMPLAIYLGFERDLDVALTLAVILLAISFGVLALVKGLLKQRVGVAGCYEDGAAGIATPSQQHHFSERTRRTKVELGLRARSLQRDLKVEIDDAGDAPFVAGDIALGIPIFRLAGTAARASPGRAGEIEVVFAEVVVELQGDVGLDRSDAEGLADGVHAEPRAPGVVGGARFVERPEGHLAAAADLDAHTARTKAEDRDVVGVGQEVAALDDLARWRAHVVEEIAVFVLQHRAAGVDAAKEHGAAEVHFAERG